jgi:hypothetical protein
LRGITTESTGTPDIIGALAFFFGAIVIAASFGSLVLTAVALAGVAL